MSSPKITRYPHPQTFSEIDALPEKFSISDSPVSVVHPDGTPLSTDSSGQLLDSFGQPIPTDDTGRAVGPDGQVLPTDDGGRLVYPSAAAPTDDLGRVIHPVKRPDGTVLSTDSSGNAVLPDGTTVIRNEDGLPVGPDGEVLPTDAYGAFVYVTPATTSKPPVSIIGPDGSLLPTDTTGQVVDASGKPIIFDSEGKPIGPDGQVLPTDSSGAFVYHEPGQALPTDGRGVTIYPVVGPDGNLLPTDSSGRAVGADGEPIPTDASGVPVSADGSPLPTNAAGQFVAVEESAVTTTEESIEIHDVGPDRAPEIASTETTAAEGSIVRIDATSGPGGVLPSDAECNIRSAKSDIVVIIDSSLQGDDFTAAVDAVGSLADNVDMSPDVTRIAVLIAGTDLVVPLPLGGYQEKQHLKDILSEARPAGGRSDSEMLKQAAHQQFATFPRPDVARVVVLLHGSSRPE